MKRSGEDKMKEVVGRTSIGMEVPYNLGRDFGREASNMERRGRSHDIEEHVQDGGQGHNLGRVVCSSEESATEEGMGESVCAFAGQGYEIHAEVHYDHGMKQETLQTAAFRAHAVN